MPQQLDLDRLHLEPGNERERPLHRRHRAERLLVAMPVQQRLGFAAARFSSSREPPGVGLAREKLLEEQRMRGELRRRRRRAALRRARRAG